VPRLFPHPPSPCRPGRAPGWTLLALLPALLLAGCAGIDRDLIPPIEGAGAGNRLPGKFVWHDLLSEDPAAARRFYGGLFGWTFDDIDVGGGQTYTLIRHQGRAIGGLVDARGINRAANVSRWVPILSVPDVDQAVAFTRAEGGTVFQPPLDVPRRGRLAVIGDDQGAVLTVLTSHSGDPVDRAPEVGGWLWNELWTTDLEQALAFYTGLVPAYAVTRVGKGEAGYTLLEAGGKPRAGVLPSPVEAMPDTWLPYVRVTDPDAVARQAEVLGGRVLLPPRANPRGGKVAILTDPTGAAFLVQTWKPHH